ncbi:hypothetical protein GCK72_005769 [Caenorhabditis remanei]|uniref:F-box associated domain-containing protein n=1 Tax=Caenorhabditis remanei TaxID=31234 RepID=A0A6A5HGH2_CAERE|nr:hypothetical protein GCK72_005769 [Caenorhabditis remanei]KAF1765816.1 hypothetical protein GCK72_005769 [Caenorhabditis remanei]
MWILYLSDLFNIQLYTISLGLDQLNSGDIQEIADLYTPRNEKETGIERMMLFKYNKKFQAEKKLIHSALRRINVTHELEIYLNPSSKFRFDFKNRQSKPMVLHLEYSKVIDINQVIEMDFQSIRLLRSKLKNYNFKLLIEKWRDGWTPKWTRLMIEFNEMLDIDSYIVGAVTEITDYRDRSVIDRNTPIHSYKFQDKQEYSFGTLIKNGYHIVRFDESVATVTVENNRIGWFDIQSNSSLSRFKALGLHPRTFYVSNDI